MRQKAKTTTRVTKTQPSSGTSRNTRTTKKESPESLIAKERITINDVLTTKVKLKCRNSKQKELSKIIDDREVSIVSGPAGCGKTYIAVIKALELIQDTSTPYSTLVLTKPIVEAEENLGFLPGDMLEKTAPHMASFIDIIDETIGESARKRLMDAGIIKIEPIAFLRGKTMNNKIVICDEMQNASKGQVKTVMTRIGANSKYIISGDIDQSDRFSNFKKSGLYDVMHRYKVIDEIGFLEFGIEDIVRNPLIGKILATYKDDETRELPIRKEILKD